MNESNRLKERPLECGRNQNNYPAIILIIFPGFINNIEAICCCQQRSEMRQHVRLFLYPLNKTQTFPSAFRPHSHSGTTMRRAHETRLLVLSGFTLTVIHMNVSSRNPRKHRKRLRSQIGAVAGSVFRRSVQVRVNLSFSPEYFSRRKFYDAPFQSHR